VCFPDVVVFGTVCDVFFPGEDIVLLVVAARVDDEGGDNVDKVDDDNGAELLVGDALKDVFLKVSPPRRKLEFNPCLDLL
jgi:hypothetical protein